MQTIEPKVKFSKKNYSYFQQTFSRTVEPTNTIRPRNTRQSNNSNIKLLSTKIMFMLLMLNNFRRKRTIGIWDQI